MLLGTFTAILCIRYKTTIFIFTKMYTRLSSHCINFVRLWSSSQFYWLVHVVSYYNIIFMFLNMYFNTNNKHNKVFVIIYYIGVVNSMLLNQVIHLCYNQHRLNLHKWYNYCSNSRQTLILYEIWISCWIIISEINTHKFKTSLHAFSTKITIEGIRDY